MNVLYTAQCDAKLFKMFNNPRLTSAWFGIITLETDKQARTHAFKTIPNQRLLWCKYGFMPNQQPTWKQCRMTVKHKQDIPAKSLDLWASRTNSRLSAIAFTARRACGAHTVALGRAVCGHAWMHRHAWRTTYMLCKAVARKRKIVQHQIAWMWTCADEHDVQSAVRCTMED